MLSTYIWLGNFVIVSLEVKPEPQALSLKRQQWDFILVGPFLSPYFIWENGIDTSFNATMSVARNCLSVLFYGDLVKVPSTFPIDQ